MNVQSPVRLGAADEEATALATALAAATLACAALLAAFGHIRHDLGQYSIMVTV
jgi:hypothetical protein